VYDVDDEMLENEYQMHQLELYLKLRYLVVAENEDENLNDEFHYVYEILNYVVSLMDLHLRLNEEQND
jgi:hypothetical protein